ncbi:MAG TPA: hypothetical protein VNM47_08635 [Terriglobia bacterium]|nr:hypothetical protein [Terriglobia bacterium]
MDDVLSRFFVVFVLLFYAIITVVFVIAAIRKWIWRPIAAKFFAHQPERGYRKIKSTGHEGSPS